MGLWATRHGHIAPSFVERNSTQARPGPPHPPLRLVSAEPIRLPCLYVRRKLELRTTSRGGRRSSARISPRFFLYQASHASTKVCSKRSRAPERLSRLNVLCGRARTCASTAGHANCAAKLWDASTRRGATSLRSHSPKISRGRLPTSSRRVFTTRAIWCARIRAARRSAMGHAAARLTARRDWCVARPEGLEPPAYWFEANRSIQLSYGRGVRNRVSMVAFAAAAISSYLAAARRILPRSVFRSRFAPAQ